MQGINLDENLMVKEDNKEAIEKFLKQHQPKILLQADLLRKNLKNDFLITAAQIFCHRLRRDISS